MSSRRIGMLAASRSRQGKGGYAGTRDMTQMKRAMQRKLLGRAQRSVALPSPVVPTDPLAKKFKDLASTTYACDTTGTITLIPDLIARGTGESERIGSQIILTSVWIRGRFVANAATTLTEGTAYLVWDRTPNKALPAITDILNSANSNSFPKDSGRRRFKILKRLNAEIAGNSTTPTTGLEIQDVEEYIKLPKGCVVEYDDTIATTGAIETIICGGLYMITVGPSAAGTGACGFAVGYRTRFANPQ